MLGFTAVLLPIPSLTKPLPPLLSNSQNLHPIFTRISIQNPRNPRRFVVFAENDNGQNKKDPKETGNGNNNGKEDLKRDRRLFLNLKWKDLLDPDPENFVAVGLTGLLTWASVQVLWQLLFISLAILVAALKYSFIAALLIFILITLL
ncbi:hypothetical protein BVC80_1711g38 [Macleaya cordata]|uniref:Transmembrane protein n=1 Tax=Macleaya cordata TaxID=56857 RepID=A0A200Q2G4_MACCD|nr:hypothetical protein BVC80_1711g38 [Macleaya cordata]